MLIDKALDTEKRAARIIADACGSETVRPEHVDAADKIIGLVGEAELGADILEAADDLLECDEILQSLTDNIRSKGHYSVESTVTYLWQARGCLAPMHQAIARIGTLATPHPTRLSERAE